MINFNRKIRGSKKPNATPIETVEDLRHLLETVVLTKRTIASKLAELYDPASIWEPLKLKLKLEFTSFNGRTWDDALTNDEKIKWSGYLEEYMKLGDLKIDRCVVPADAEDLNMRMICISDASEKAGGAAIYATFKLRSGKYSAQLLTARSHLMESTVPRNELEAIMIMTYAAHVTYRSMVKYVEDILYFTDSRIALCWVRP